jgi:hypothetical protein
LQTPFGMEEEEEEVDNPRPETMRKEGVTV